MQILLIGDNSLTKTVVASLLDFHPAITRTDFVFPAETDNITQYSSHCIIYIERSPNRSLIDKLHKNTKNTLLLIAEEDYRSHLFVPFDSLMPDNCFAASLEIITNNIKSLISLCKAYYQADLFPLILPDEDKPIIERQAVCLDSLFTSGNPTSANRCLDAHNSDETSVSQQRSNKSSQQLSNSGNNIRDINRSTKKNQVLSHQEQQAYDSWMNRESVKIASSKLNVSIATYHRMVNKAKRLLGELESSSA